MITATQTETFQAKAEYNLGYVWLVRDWLTCAQQLEKSAAKFDCFATSLPTMLLFVDDLQFRQGTTALLLQAQAQLGLGRRASVKTLLRSVLRRDPNHALAADLLWEIET